MTPLTATITSITRIGQSDQMQVTATFSDNTIQTYTMPIDTDRVGLKAVIKADLDRVNSLQGKVNNLQNLIGTVLS